MSAGPRTPFENPVVEWIDVRLPIFSMLVKEYGVFPTPRNFNYFWSFGGIALTMLVIMIISGITLSMHYVANTSMAFESVERIMRDVNYGWLIRYIHMNGASFFFIAVYIHIFRGMFYGSFKKPRELMWILGVTIFLLMMATAFLGYVLPWGQMSFWGAKVITSLFSAIPFVGDSIVTWLWGGFSVDNATLNRFFSLHFLLPFVIFAVVFLHVWALHVSGSNNPLGIDVKGPQDTLPFHPYYTVKDSVGLLAFLLVYTIFVFYMPNALGHPDNYIPANPMVTPAHIVPEWYFLPFYAILRSITFWINPYSLIGFAGLGYYLVTVVWDKARSDYFTPRNLALLAVSGLLTVVGIGGALFAEFVHIPFADIVLVEGKLLGVLAMFGSILLVLLMPWLDTHPVRSALFRPLYKIALFAFVASVFVLGYVGAQPAEGIWPWVGLGLTGYYMAFLLVILPLLSKHEKALPLPASIHEAVLAQKV